jgi:mannose-6-phosphate isomerase-like protein (cupin superfamily)
MPYTPTSRENAAHYFWGERCDGWHLLQDPNLSVIEERVPAGASEIRHHHNIAQQFFYILEGHAVMKVAGEWIQLSPGQGIAIPPGVSHQFRNESEKEVRFLTISQPPSHGDRVNA